MAALLANCSGSKLSKDDLRIAAGDIRAFAAATDLLAQEQLAGHLTKKFFTTQSESLLDKAHASKKSLESPAGELESFRKKIADIASKLETQLLQIQTSGPTNADRLAFAEMTTTARNIEELLKDK